MQKSRRTPVLLSLLSLLASLMILIPSGVANAVESFPTLQWPSPVTIGATDSPPVTSPNGDITVPCQPGSSGSDLVTYSATGQLVRQIPRTPNIDGVPNCITVPIADKNGHVYGRPYGKVSGVWKYGANLLAYNGNTLKWKYPLACSSGAPSYEVGANGNIYSTKRLSSGAMRLIGLSPEVAVGQTQPTKVLDIPISTNCTTILRTYKDGVVLHDQSNGNAWYYSYSGKFLGQATIGSLWDEKIDAEGRLFVPSLVAGSYQSVSVSRYDPDTGTVKWTTSASTAGMDTNDVTLSPLPGGGVAALITEQEISAAGGEVPSSPTVWVKTLVVINPNGQKVYSEQLQNTYADGTFGNSYLTSASGGKVVVTRELAVNTGLSYPTTVPGVAVRVFDPSSNTWTYSQGIIGDLTKSGGPSGYMLDALDLIAAQPVNDTLYVRAECTDNCDGSKKLFAVAVTGMGNGYPRGETLLANTPIQPSPLPYVALGDSYSSAQGAGEYDAGTVTATNRCYKSRYAYGRILDRDPYSAFSLTAFVACGGAVASDITTTTTYSGVSSVQKDALDSTTKLVTVTIGGNDIGFADVIITCADPTKDCDGAFSGANALLGSIFDNKLQTAYLGILQKATTAEVYVLGYPPILASGSSGCLVGNNGGSLPFYDATRVEKGVTLLESLNAAIENNVNTIRSLGSNYQRLHYVDAADTASPFSGHDVCSSTPYLNGLVVPGDSSESFHPNKPGQQAYADLVTSNS